MSGNYGTALAAAAFKGRTDIVWLLLDRGADINAVGGEYGTALVAAAVFERRMQISLLLLLHLVGVRTSSLLLDRGADINMVGGKYGTALATAAFHRRIQIMLLLLARGADINVVGGDCISCSCIWSDSSEYRHCVSAARPRSRYQHGGW